MNERIKELAEQTSYIWHASGDPQIYEFTPEKLEKFAELIVRECGRVYIQNQQDGVMTLTEDLLYHLGIKK